MRRVLLLLLALSANLQCLTARPARSQSPRADREDLLTRVRGLASRQQFQQAEKLLRDELRRHQGDTRAVALYSTSLGEVYSDSGDYKNAEHWLDRARQYFDAALPLRANLNEQSSVVLRLADVQIATGRAPQAVGTLRQMLARYRETRIVDPANQIEILVRLAALGKKRLLVDDPQSNLKAEIERLATTLLARIDDADKIEPHDERSLVGLAEYHASNGDFAAAIAILKRLPEQSHSDTAQRIASIHRRTGDSAAEIAVLRSALQSGQPSQVPNQPENEQQSGYDRAELARLLAEALARTGDRDEAIQYFRVAQESYRQALTIAPTVRYDATARLPLAEVSLLEKLVEVSGKLLALSGSTNLTAAIEPHETLLKYYLENALPGDPRIFRLRVALAGLQLNASRFPAARDQLILALDYWRKRKPSDYSMLGQTWNLLGELNLATGFPNEADRCLKEAMRICDTHLPGDELGFWVRINRGRVVTSAGKYRDGLALFEEVLSANGEHRASAKLRGAALLHQGLLYKDLFQFDKAADLCQQATLLRQQELGPDHIDLLPYCLALGGLHIARRDANSLSRTLTQAEALIANLPEDTPSRLAIAHQQAMVHYLRDEAKSDPQQRIAAREHWQKLLPLCQSVDRARVLHYLARLDYLDWSAELKAWNELQSKQLADHRLQEEKYHAEVEELNARTSAHTQARREYQRQLESYRDTGVTSADNRRREYDRLKVLHSELDRQQIHLHALSRQLAVRQESLHAAALKSLAHGRGDRDKRTPDWIKRLARGERLASEAASLLAESQGYPSLQYSALCNQAQILHARAQLLDKDGGPLASQAIEVLERAVDVVENPRSNTVGSDAARAEFFAQYEAAFDLLVQFCVESKDSLRALVAAERGRARSLLDQLRTADVAYRPPRPVDLAQTVDRWQKNRETLLYYYVGAATSYLFVLGGPDAKCEVFPLTRPPDPGAPLGGIDVSAGFVAARVAELRDQIADRENARQLGSDAALRDRMAQISSIFVPPVLQTMLRGEQAQGATHVIVIPHGSISQLPLEALLALPSAKGDSVFLVDVAPPLVYAPSLTVLDSLRQRRQADRRAPRILTAGNPAYRRAQALAPLEHSQAECERIAQAFRRPPFGEEAATLLTQDDATEARIRATLGSQGFSMLHLAAHSTLGEEQGRSFGRIAVTCPAEVTATNDDGYFQLSEIYDLNLLGCKLTALSACSTNTGALLKVADGAHRVSRRDPSFSLAGAFLAAGSSRVLVTHWEVADDSTADLVALYFEKLADRLAAGDNMNYATILAETRRDWRKQHPEQDTPFHWAPLLLIGPAE